MCKILNSYNKVSQRKNVIKNIIRENMYIILYLWEKKSTSKWTHVVQTHVVQWSVVLSCSEASSRRSLGIWLWGGVSIFRHSSGFGEPQYSVPERHISSFPFIHLSSILSVLTFPNPECKLPCSGDSDSHPKQDVLCFRLCNIGGVSLLWIASGSEWEHLEGVVVEDTGSRFAKFYTPTLSYQFETDGKSRLNHWVAFS